ncbi:hypothetical protein BDZ91DRAFT_701278, partial [Kalaharituber pfeilii]
MSTIHQLGCIGCTACQHHAENHDTGRVITINVKSPHDDNDNNINATEFQLANGTLTIRLNISSLIPHALTYQEHPVCNNHNAHTAISPKFEGGSFSTAVPECKTIAFDDPFSSPPEVIIGLNMFDFNNLKNLRLKLSADDIMNSSFKLNATTWSDTVMHSMGCDWLAVHNSVNGADMGLHISTGIYNTANDPAWKAPIKQLVHHVQFQKPYHAIPTVVIWICGTDMGRDTYIRLRVAATDVTTQGFNINVYSWFDTITYSVIVSWLAYPSGLPGIESGSFSTAAQLPFRATSPDPGEHKFIAFENPFPSPPEIIAGLNVVDCDHRKNLRIRIFADNITMSSFKLNATTWSDSIAYNIGCDWLA